MNNQNISNLAISRFIIIYFALLISCRTENEDDSRPEPVFPPSAELTITIKFDPLQDRLDSFGVPNPIPIGHEALSPNINGMKIGFIELLSDSIIPYNDGLKLLQSNIVYNASDTGYKCCSDLIPNNFIYETSISSTLIPDTFKYIRIYFVYENLDISYKFNNNIYAGSVAAFLAPKALTFNYQISDSAFNSYSLKTNGQWYFEVDTPGFGTILSGDALTTQPNILYNSNPVPSGGCIVTCPITPFLFLDKPDSISITISISTNKSFEWIEHSDPAFFEPFDGDTIVDVGIRGIKVLQ